MSTWKATSFRTGAKRCFLARVLCPSYGQTPYVNASRIWWARGDSLWHWRTPEAKCSIHYCRTTTGDLPQYRAENWEGFFTSNLNYHARIDQNKNFRISNVRVKKTCEWDNPDGPERFNAWRHWPQYFIHMRRETLASGTTKIGGILAHKKRASQSPTVVRCTLSVGVKMNQRKMPTKLWSEDNNRKRRRSANRSDWPVPYLFTKKWRVTRG